jgi:hypothetical protein
MSQIYIYPPRSATIQEIYRAVRDMCNLLNNSLNVPEDSTAANLGDLTDDFNALLEHFRNVTTGELP